MRLTTASKEYLHDRRLLHRTGLAVERHTLRREHEVVWIVWYAILAASMMLFMASCDEAFAEVYDSSDICDAIYIIEGREQAKKPYGILSVPCNGEADCRDICLNTVENTFTRWQVDGSKGDFLEDLAARYCPVGASNDPQGLNRHWLDNVRQLLAEGGK